LINPVRFFFDDTGPNQQIDFAFDRGASIIDPVNGARELNETRAEILAALTCIDYVTIFTEPTAGPLVALLQPAIYVKGGDYAAAQGDLPDPDRLPEASIVQAYGGIVRLIPYLPHHSTTALIEAIKQLPERS